MAIVPLANNVSIKTIRDVINQKAILIGQVRSVGTTYTMYGYDKKTGYVQAHIKNISSSTINITTTLEKADGNIIDRVETTIDKVATKHNVNTDILYNYINNETGV